MPSGKRNFKQIELRKDHMRYSPNTNSFYPHDLDAGLQLPSDLIDIPDAEYAALLEGLDQGKWIGPGKDGRPTLEEPIDDSEKRRALQAIYRITAHALTETSDERLDDAVRQVLAVVDGCGPAAGQKSACAA